MLNKKKYIKYFIYIASAHFLVSVMTGFCYMLIQVNRSISEQHTSTSIEGILYGIISVLLFPTKQIISSILNIEDFRSLFWIALVITSLVWASFFIIVIRVFNKIKK
jgi:hypothetical protein